MFCEQCGKPLNPGDVFCQSCGHPVAVTSANAGEGNDFDGPTELNPTAGQAPAVPPVPSVSPVPGAPQVATGQQPVYDSPTVIQGQGQAEAYPTFQYQSYQDSQPIQPIMGGARVEGAGAQSASGNGVGVATGATAGAGGDARKPVGLIVGIAVAAVALVALIGALIWFLVIQPRLDSSDTVQNVSQGQDAGQAGASDGASSGKQSNNQSKGDKEAAPCGKAPDMSVTSFGSEPSGDGLSMDLTVTSSCDGSALNLDEATQLTITDQDGSTVAAGVFDFSQDPVTADAGEDAKTTVVFDKGDYWRLPSELPKTATWTVNAKLGASTSGGSDGSSTSDGLHSVPIADDSAREAAAKSAIDWQIKHDKSDASRFLSTVTTQLSSKQLNMQVDGKTWKYQDIYQQFVDLHKRLPNAMMLWSGDWPTYNSTGTGDYYVIISGEGFSSVDDGWNWCSSNGFGQNDCLPVDLQ